MAATNVLLKNITLSFNTIGDLSAFKKECACNDFYIDRDARTLVGSFTEDQLKLATSKYFALYYAENILDHHNFK